MPIRIGLVFEYSSINGGENSILAAIDHLQHRTTEFYAIVHQPGPLVSELERRNILVVQLFEGKRPGELLDHLRELVSSLQLDLLHANSLTIGRRLGRISSKLSVPTTCHIRDIMQLSSAALSDLQAHHRLIAVSDATRESYIAQGLPVEQIVTIHNGVDLLQFQPAPATGAFKRKLGLPDSAFVCACIGQICLRKGQTDYATAVSRLGETFPDLHALLIGTRHSTKQETTEYDHQIDTITEAAGLESRFHRLGFRQDVPEILNEIDLLVHTARQEPLGRVLLEAAACGTPIVATRVGGTAEILTDDESALLVNPGDIEEMTHAISRLVTNPELRGQLGSAARTAVAARFDISHSAERLNDLWNEVIQLQ